MVTKVYQRVTNKNRVDELKMNYRKPIYHVPIGKSTYDAETEYFLV